MLYYKIVKDGHIIDVGSAFLKWNAKWHQLFSCDANDAQFVQGRDGDTLYRPEWMREPPADTGLVYTIVDTGFINEREYEYLLALLEEGDEIDDTPPEEEEQETEPDEEPAPDTEPAMTISQMRQYIAEMNETLSMLTDCILEMSEAVYGGDET